MFARRRRRSSCNLNEDGYLTATDTELAEAVFGDAMVDANRAQCLATARAVIADLDPVGVGARDLRECLLRQIEELVRELEDVGGVADTLELAQLIVDKHLALLQKKDMRELVRLCHRPAEEVQAAVEVIRHLDPRPGQRHSATSTRLIEPDVAFVKRDDKYVVVMNEEGLPTLRLNAGYRKMRCAKRAWSAMSASM